MGKIMLDLRRMVCAVEKRLVATGRIAEVILVSVADGSRQ
jgi:hypothetical protein